MAQKRKVQVIEHEPAAPPPEEDQSPRGDQPEQLVWWWDWQEMGVVIRPNTPFEEWEKLWAQARATHGSINWWIGDVLCFARATYPETWTQALDKHGVDIYENAMWMANVYKPDQRIAGVSWSAHREVAKLEPELRNRWLQRARKEDWKVEDLKKHLRDEQTAAANYPRNAPPDPEPPAAEPPEPKTTAGGATLGETEEREPAAADQVNQPQCPQCESTDITEEEADPPYLVCNNCGWDNKPEPAPQLAEQQEVEALPQARSRIDAMREAIDAVRRAAPEAALGQEIPDEVQTGWASCARQLLNLPLILRLLTVEKAMEWLPQEWEMRGLSASSWVFGGRKFKVEVRKGKTNVAYSDGPWMAGAVLDAAFAAQISEMGERAAAAD